MSKISLTLPNHLTIEEMLGIKGGAEEIKNNDELVIECKPGPAVSCSPGNAV